MTDRDHPDALEPTTFLELHLETDVPDAPVRALDLQVARGRSLPMYVAVPTAFEVGVPLRSVLRHPRRPELAVKFLGEVGLDGCARLGRPSDPMLLGRLFAALNGVDSPLPRFEARPQGSTSRSPWGLLAWALVTGGACFLTLGPASRFTSTDLPTAVAWLVTSALASVALKQLVRAAPPSNVTSAAWCLASGLALSLAAALLDDWQWAGPAPALFWGALRLFTSRHARDWKSFAWLSSANWARASMTRSRACQLCGRRHLPAAQFVTCQFGNCRAPMPSDWGCACPECCEIVEVRGTEAESRFYRDSLKANQKAFRQHQKDQETWARNYYD